MRRATARCLLTAALLFTLPVAAHAQAPSSTVNAIGMVDFRYAPTFKTGDFVRYQVNGETTSGVREDYTLTLLIAGEELFWGERCFWVETWTQAPGSPPTATATLMSYAIFGDSLAVPRVQKYSRRMIYDGNEKGEPVARVTRQAAASFRQREAQAQGVTIVTDTVGTDTVVTPRGTFTARIAEVKMGAGTEASGGDSTVYSEVRETRTRAITDKIPITHIVSEQIDRTTNRRAWMAGRSKEGAPARLEEQSLTTARVVEFGTGLQSQLLPTAVTPGGAPILPSRATSGTKGRSRSGG